MNDGPVAEILAAHYTTTGADTELWHRVARGEMSVEDAHAEIMAKGLDGGELEHAKQVFGPPSQEQRDAVLEVLLAQQRGDERQSGSGGSESEDGEPSSTSTVVVPIQRSRAWRWLVGSAVVAAAVLIFVLVRPPSEPSPESAPLLAEGKQFSGGYVLELDYVTSSTRGSEQPVEVATFLSGGKIGVRLVPEETPAGPVEAAVFIRDQDGRSRRLDVDPTLHATGVVEIATTLDALGLGKGDWELVVAIGWASAVPESWEEVMAAAEAKRAQIVRTKIRVEE